MLNITIVGDSWGEPNWRRPIPGHTAEGHVSYLLQHQGFAVENYSISGGSNLATWLNLARNSRRPIDWIIWFHTDISRDFLGHELDHPWHSQELIDRTANRVYGDIQRIVSQSAVAANMLVIEGQSCVHEPHFSERFSWARMIRDWRSQLLGQQMPRTQLLGPMSSGGGNFLDNCRDSYERKMQLITDVETVLQAMHEHDLFPDNCHPGDLAHQQLAQTILGMITPPINAA